MHLKVIQHLWLRLHLTSYPMVHIEVLDLSPFQVQVIRLKGLPVPPIRRPNNVSPPPPLPRVRGRSYFRNLKTPRPPIPLHLDTQLLHVSRQPGHSRQFDPSQMVKKNMDQEEEMDQAMTFTEDQMTNLARNPLPPGPIGIAHDMI